MPRQTARLPAKDPRAVSSLVDSVGVLYPMTLSHGWRSTYLLKVEPNFSQVDLEHGWVNPIWWGVAIKEGFNVDDHFLTHINPTLNGCRTHMRQGHNTL